MTTDRPTHLGMVGLGRMGSNLVRRLMRDGHPCVAFDLDPAAVEAVRLEGATGVDSLAALVAALPAPRSVWLMLPAGEITERAIAELAGLVEPGDAIIDGGNTHYVDDLAREAQLTPLGIHYVDVGVSGGVFGLERGFCLMVGRRRRGVRAPGAAVRCRSRPASTTAARTRGRDGAPVARGDGLSALRTGRRRPLREDGAQRDRIRADGRARGGAERARSMPTPARGRGTQDAETTPLEHPERYRFEIDVAEVAEVWRRGSVVSSWLLDLAAAALHESPQLEGFAGRVSDSGEGRWTAIAAIEEGVPAPALSAALFARFDSRGEADFANRVLSAMRKEFGGHAEKLVSPDPASIRIAVDVEDDASGVALRGAAVLAGRVSSVGGCAWNLRDRRVRRHDAVGDVRGPRGRGRPVGGARDLAGRRADRAVAVTTTAA